MTEYLLAVAEYFDRGRETLGSETQHLVGAEEDPIPGRQHHDGAAEYLTWLGEDLTCGETAGECEGEVIIRGGCDFNPAKRPMITAALFDCVEKPYLIGIDPRLGGREVD